ncbi:MAG: vWA domain-containing protein [Myxococcota bacterium]
MNARDLTPWLLFLMVIGISACVDTGGSNDFEAYLVQKDDDDDDVCDPDEDDYDPTDPRCQPAGPGGSGSTLPAECPTGDPTCARAYDFPTQDDLTIENSSNVAFSSSNGGMRLLGGSSSIVDSDGDFVPDEADECPGPGWRAPCDADPSDDGIYQTVYYDVGNEITLGAQINVDGKIRTADAYFLMDATGSMVGEQVQLITDLTEGTFIDPVECPAGNDTGLVGALQCVVEDVWMGLGQFNEYPVHPYGHAFGYAPYHHHLDVTNNLQHLLDAVSALTTRWNRDDPEALTQALYSVITGQGLGPWVPNRAGCPDGRWGYACFRPTALPIIILFTDDEMHNGPRPASSTYGPAPLGGVGFSTLIPPARQNPGMIYSGSPATAYDWGDLSNLSMTALGTNALHGDNINTSFPPSPCGTCTGTKCWGDGRDGWIRFSLSSSVPSVSISSEGTFYPRTKLALVDAPTLTQVACDFGPGGGDYWGRFNVSPMSDGDWFVANDSSIKPGASVNDNRGPFQIRVQTTASDPSWATAEVPIPWTDVETALLSRAVKVVQILSPGHGDLAAASADVDALAVATDSLDQFGQPYRQDIQGDGTGLSTAVLDAVRSLVGDTRRDVTVIPEDNPATPGIDESNFVGAVVATQCPTTGINNCLGTSADGQSCLGCLADSQLEFEFRVGNDFVLPSGTAQVFDFDLVSVADGSIELNRIPVRVMVPPGGLEFGTGFYEVSYEADLVCEMPPDGFEVPDWGVLNWSGSTPSDTKIEFEIWTGNTPEDFENQIPLSIVIPDDTASETIDLGPALVGGGKLNYSPLLRIRAKMLASSDSLTTPVLAGWSLQFNCIPFE